MPVFRERGQDRDRDKDRESGKEAIPRHAQSATPQPIRMVLDDETVDHLRVTAAAYGMEVEELMVALLQAAAERIPELLGEPPSRLNAN